MSMHVIPASGIRVIGSRGARMVTSIIMGRHTIREGYEAALETRCFFFKNNMLLCVQA